MAIHHDNTCPYTFNSGTTWMQEIVWLVCNNANTKVAKDTRLTDRFGFVDLPQFSGAGIGLQGLENWPNDKRRYFTAAATTWIYIFVNVMWVPCRLYIYTYMLNADTEFKTWIPRNWSNCRLFRFVKTHMPVEFLPNELQRAPKGKMICVARNPKDNCVSLYHFQRMNMMFPNPGPWNEFFVDFCQGNVQLGSWFDHVHGYWQVGKG